MMAVDERAAVDLSALEAAASAVPDPELPVVTLGDLGIVRGVSLADDGAVEVRITPTFVGCPATEAIAADVRTTVAAHLRESGAADVPVRTRTEMSPPWTTDWISEAGRRKLADHGIAPPTGSARHTGGPVAVTLGRPGSGAGGFDLAPGGVQQPEHAGVGASASVGAADAVSASAADRAPGSADSAGASAQNNPSSPSPSPHPPTQLKRAAQVCPRCGSADTRELSAFGSTPCQSLRACRACGEPFGAIKSL